MVLLAVLALTSLLNDQFLSGQGRRDILLFVAPVALMAIGQTFVIVMRHVDLSVGSTLGLAAYVSADVVQRIDGLPLFSLFVTGAVVGISVGAINGVLVAWLRLPALVVTLGTMYVIQGLRNILIGGARVNADQLPDAVINVGIESWLGIPHLMWLVFLVLLIAAPVARYTRFGRDLYAMGSNPDAAERVGIAISRRTIAAFMVSGLCAGLAGAASLARYAGTDSRAGVEIELTVVAACVVGGVFIFGGSGSPFGAVIGALLLQVLTMALPALHVSAFWQRAVVGALIIGAICVDRIAVLRLERQRRRESRR